MRLAIKTFIFAICYFQTISIIIYCFDLHRCFCQLKHWFNFFFHLAFVSSKFGTIRGSISYFFLFILQIASAFENSISNSFNFNHTKRIESDENVIQRQYYHEISGQTTNTLQTPETQQKTNSESCMCIFFAHNSARFISYVWKLTLAKNTMLIGSVFLVNCKKLPTDNFPQQKSLDVPFLSSWARLFLTRMFIFGSVADLILSWGFFLWVVIFTELLV